MKYFIPLILLASLAGCGGESDGEQSAAALVTGLNPPAKIAAVPAN